MNDNKVKLLTLSGLFSALIFVVTMIHVPTGNGYTHAGDGIIYLAGCLLPTPYAVAASAIGGALADGLSGAAIWIPATVLIKVLTALCFSDKTEKIICLRNILAVLPSLILCFVGYGIYEAVFILGSFSKETVIAAFTQIPSYLVQVSASTVLFIVLGTLLDKMKFKDKLRYKQK